jgi:hypothetical protein
LCAAFCAKPDVTVAAAMTSAAAGVLTLTMGSPCAKGLAILLERQVPAAPLPLPSRAALDVDQSGSGPRLAC